MLASWAISACNSNAQNLTIAGKDAPQYSIVVPAQPTPLEARSAKVLQKYLQDASGIQLPIVQDGSVSGNAIYLGHTHKAEQLAISQPADEGYLLKTAGKDIVIVGGSGRGLVYGVYTFLEHFAGCAKLDNGPALVKKQDAIKVPVNLNEVGKQLFMYRECYYPATNKDDEYQEWHQLHRFDELWGLWGHSYDKLVPAATYFNAHPEYFALVKGVRKPGQLCLSNDEVFKIVTNELKKRIADNPEALYWSVSPNDDIGYCECDKCSAVDVEQGSHAASLVQFVNRVAAEFPNKRITTLAYGYTHNAPRTLKPASNVYIMLSNIDVYRDKPVAEHPSAATFRQDLKQWKSLTPNLLLWDYVTQFTNYLAPFPNLQTLQPNMAYYRENGIKGIFTQGSGDTYSEWAELRSYVIAQLYRNDKAEVRPIVEDFLMNYYGPAAKFLLQYIGQLHGNMVESKRKLDIYGNPVNEWNSFLTPANLESYTTIFDGAEGAVANNPLFAKRVARARLPIEYTILQQARFYGTEKYGVFLKAPDGSWKVNSNIKQLLNHFVDNARKAGVTELSEGGLTPDQYYAEWQEIFKAGVTHSIAQDAKVTIKNAYAPEYPAKGPRTLVDGNPGYKDFSYNWLCFYGVDMVATLDLGSPKQFSTVRMHFLDDPRHWIFLPSTINVEVSDDGLSYRKIADAANPTPTEHYDVSLKDFVFPVSVKARFLRVTATNPAALPVWRYRENRKPMIACDEIFLQ